MMLFHYVWCIIVADVIAMWKMLNHILFEVGVNLFVIWYRLMLLPDVFLFVGRCYCQSIMVDVKTLRLMLLPVIFSFLLADVIANAFVADVITTCSSMRRCYLWLMLLPYICGRCYNHWGWCYCLLCLYLLADVIPNIVADVMATFFLHNVLADVIARWQME